VEFSDAVGYDDREAQQIRRFAKDRDQPTPERQAVIDTVLFGETPSDYAPWREALHTALGLERTKQAVGVALHVEPSKPSAVSLARAGLIPIRVPLHFTGRDHDLARIEAALVAPPHRVALFGLHGVGKSLLAAAYAATRQTRYEYIAWLDSGSPQTLAASLAALGEVLGCTSGCNTQDEMTRATLAHLGAASDGILLVFDGADTPRSLHEFIPGGKSVHVLITSVSPNWRAETKPIEVNSWTGEIAAAFLTRRLGRALDQTDARALSDDVGGLPLGLEIAAAFMEQRNCTASACRSAFAAAGRRLADPETSPPAYPRLLTAAVDASIEAAKDRHPAASDLLQLLATFGPAPIPDAQAWTAAELLAAHAATTLSVEEFNDVVAALRAFSLISIESCELQANPRPALSLHRIIRTLVNERRRGHEFHATAIIAVASVYPHDLVTSAERVGYRMLIAHAKHLEATAPDSLDQFAALAELRLRMGNCDLRIGAFRSGLQLLRASLAVTCGGAGDDPMLTSMALAGVATAFIALEMPWRALPAARAALALRERFTRPHDVGRADILLLISRALSLSGQDKASDAAASRALALYSPDSTSAPDRQAQQYNAFGLASYLLDRNEAAVTHLQQAATIYRSLAPVPHEPLAQTYTHLGHAYLSLGRHDQALEAFDDAVDALRFVEPWPTDAVAAALCHSAEARFALRNYVDAESDIIAALALMPKTRHETVTAWRVLAAIACVYRNYDAAVIRTREALSCARALDDTALTKDCTRALALLYRSQGRLQEARQVADDAGLDWDELSRVTLPVLR
jgi:tetratricopeptide (TPR) repeat protein